MSRLFAFLLILVSCNPADRAGESNQISDFEPVKEIILDDLRRPWSMAFISENEAMLAEKDGDLLRVDLESKSKTPILGFPEDLADTVAVYADRFEPGVYPGRAPAGLRTKYNAGIFQVVLDPDFENNDLIYVSYAAEKDEMHTTKVIRAELKGNTLSNVEALFTATPYSTGLFHFGGGMVFGNDGKLYFTIGERLFSEAQQPALPIAQDVTDRRGKIYRINSDGSIPSDNPDFGSDAIPGLYALGIRASQGLTLEASSGDIWFTEHGTNQGDELNLLKAGANYGWPVRTTGTYRGPGYEPPKMEGTDFTPPTWYWHQTIAPTGLVFYTGDEFPHWTGNLIVPGLSAGNFWRLAIEDQKVKSLEQLFVDDRHRTRKAVQSPDGKLYILTDEVDGKLIRVRRSKE